MSIGARRLTAAQAAGLLSAVERRLGVTSSGLGLVVVAGAGWMLARTIGSRSLFLLVYGGLVVLAASWLAGRRRLGVVAARSELPTRVREGQVVEVELEMTARRRISVVVLTEELPPHMGTSVRVPVPLLAAGGTVTHRYTFSPKLRGVYNVGPLVATWSDPFGLTRRTMVLTAPEPVIVHPTTETVHDRVLSREWEDPPIRPPVSKPWPSGFEFYGMRDYTPGDDPRRIVWRATARTLDPLTGHGRYFVRESEQGITDRVTLVIDNDRSEHSPGDPSDTFEAAVRAVASLGAKHIKDGFAVTIESNGGRIADSLRGGAKRIPLLDSLAKLTLEPVSLLTAIDRLMTAQRRDTHMVLVTPHLEPDVATRLRLLVDRGVSVLLVFVVTEDTDPSSLHRAGSLGCNVVEVTPDDPLEGTFRRVVAAGVRR